MAVEPKIILRGAEARERILKGAEIMAQVVGTTMGLKGRNIALSSKYAGTKVIHDGVGVSREVYLKDPTENIGAILLREAAEKTNDATGDGTTTATVLGYEIAREGNTHIVAGVNPMLMVNGIALAAKEIVKQLEAMAEPIEGNLEKMIQIATISAANEEIGKKIAEALEKVGEYGVVNVDSGSDIGYHVEYKDGMEWDKGWVHPGFVLLQLNNKPNLKLEARIEDPYILVTDHTITASDEVLPLLTKLKGANIKNLVIISDGLEREAMSLLGMNFEKGVFNILPLSAPMIANHKKDALEDIAILTGAKFISSDMAMKLQDVEIADLGRADYVSAFRDSSTIVGGRGDVEKIKARAEQIQETLNAEKVEITAEKYRERLAKLTSGVAVMKVGMSSDAERDEKIERVRDAIGATKAAVEGGIIPGGGMPLLRLSEKLSVKTKYPEEQIGVEILKKALKKPIRLLAENAGVNGDVVINEVLKSKTDDIGFDVVSGAYVPLRENGIIDPVAVTISAVQNAVSVASMLLTTEASIVDLPEDKKNE